MEDWCSIQANTPLYFPHRSNTPDITLAHLSSSSLLVIIKTPITHHHSWSSSKLSLPSKFSSLTIMIKTLFVLTALGKVRVFAFAVIAGPINKRMGHPGPQNCAQQMSAEISICRMKVKYQKWLYREMIKPFCEICIFRILSEL